METCTHCNEKKGFYMMAGKKWCLVCGHLFGAAKQFNGPPTSAPEIQIKLQRPMSR